MSDIEPITWIPVIIGLLIILYFSPYLLWGMWQLKIT
jgi:hypothetical protein